MTAKVQLLIIPKQGTTLRVVLSQENAQAIVDWYRNPGSADVPVHIPNANNPHEVHSFLPCDIIEIGLVP